MPNPARRARSANVAEQYDSSDDALYRPVDTDELAALINAGGRPVLRDAGKLTHLLTRMHTTLSSQQQTISGMHRHISQVQESIARQGTPTTLNPLDALRYLDDEQRELLFDRIARERLALLRHLVDDATGTRENLLTELDQIRRLATAIAQRPDLPVDIRGEFTRLITQLPAHVPEVHRSGMLDYGDPDAVAGATPQPPAPPAPHSPWTPPERPAGTASAYDDDAPVPRPRVPSAPPPVWQPEPEAHYVDPYGRSLPADETPDTDDTDTPVFIDPWGRHTPPTDPTDTLNDLFD